MAALRRHQGRRTWPGARFQRASASLVSRMPWTTTRSLTLIPKGSAGRPPGLRRGLLSPQRPAVRSQLTKRSRPSPRQTSRPGPPDRMSLPGPPTSVSLPAPPARQSSFEPPTRRSLPASPRRRSPPLVPTSRSRPGVPARAFEQRPGVGLTGFVAAERALAEFVVLTRSCTTLIAWSTSRVLSLYDLPLPTAKHPRPRRAHRNHRKDSSD